MRSAVLRQWEFKLPISSLCINRKGDWVIVALGDGTARTLPASDEASSPKELRIHNGVSLSLTKDADDHAFISGGDDGCVVMIDPALGETSILSEKKGQWIDHVDGSADGKYRAYNIGKQIYLVNEEGQEKVLTAPSHPGGVLFSPSGKRLAVSHYNGVSLWWTSSQETEPTTLEWKGSHLNMVWSPDGTSLLSSMQDGALHGWLLASSKEMRMQGYASKVRSMEFTNKGKYLATSGAQQIICWPFANGGPWGKPPVTLGGNENRLVTQVAPHPKDNMIAAGYDDGMIVLAPLDGRMEIMINPPLANEGMNINGLAWNADGSALFASSAGGCLMLFTIDSVRKAVVQT